MKSSKMNDLYFGEGNIRSIANNSFCYLTWSLPSQKTCPFSTELCRKYCFAKKNENFKNVISCRERNFEATTQNSFEEQARNYISNYFSKEKCKNKILIIRIHTSGDFYSEEYLSKWISISNSFKGISNIKFQSYTKSVQFLLGKKSSDTNIHFVYSQWDDSDPQDVNAAKSLGLPIFYATSKDNLKLSKGYVCPKTSDGKCHECYTDNYGLIVTNYH